MYPVNVLVQQIWSEHIRPHLDRPDSNPDHIYVELLAVCEHLVNYGHTGSMRVLTTGLMRRLWPSRAIVDTGFPAFSSALTFCGPTLTIPIMDISTWPIDLETGYPLYASKRALELTYGKAHFLVSRSLIYLRMPAPSAPT